MPLSEALFDVCKEVLDWGAFLVARTEQLEQSRFGEVALLPGQVLIETEAPIDEDPGDLSISQAFALTAEHRVEVGHLQRWHIPAGPNASG
jgi:hypothetical protein